MSKHTPRVLAIDAGGTLTDTFIVDERGEFVVGKAQTTPDDEAQGFLASSKDALDEWCLPLDRAFPQLRAGTYSGTSMLNRLLERKGARVGVIVTAGMEDYLKLERSCQTYLGYSYSDRLHVVTHRHNEPLVPSELIRGVRGRIDVFGDVAIPAYEDEIRAAVDYLLVEKEVEALCVNLLHSYKNPLHERLVERIALGVTKERGKEVPIFLSSDLYPIRRDFPRLNNLLIEAYAAEPSRAQLRSVAKSIRTLGAPFELRIMASHGGTISIEARELARTLISGPIGGVIGAKSLADQLGFKYVACTDIGGTSFDVALITAGEYQIKPNPDIGHFLLNLPMVEIDSVGAGTGSYVRLNPSSRRIEIGPDSAGYRIGVCNRASGITTPTITDCSVVLGLLNPDYFLGGQVQLDKEAAYSAIAKQIAGPLGLDAHEAAAGVLELFEDSLRNMVSGLIFGKGYSPPTYALLCYGGGGPVHVCGYSEGLEFDDILIPAWAAGFSAFGCACADYEYRFDQTVDVQLSPTMAEEEKSAQAVRLNESWKALRQKVLAEFARSNVAESQIHFSFGVRVQYAGQLNDLEIWCPFEEVSSPEDLDVIVEIFEELYGKVYARAAKSPELGYTFTTAIGSGSTDVEKPLLPNDGFAGPIPPRAAHKGSRSIYSTGEWQEADIWAMESLLPGNCIKAPAVIESPATTLVVTPGHQVTLDEHRIFHLRRA